LESKSLPQHDLVTEIPEGHLRHTSGFNEASDHGELLIGLLGLPVGTGSLDDGTDCQVKPNSPAIDDSVPSDRLKIVQREFALNVCA
jgi:hypothetical protein